MEYCKTPVCKDGLSQAEAATLPTSPEILYGFTAFCNETRPLEALGFPQRLTERVLTKLAATECIENGQCAKSRTLDEQHLFEMEALMEEVALESRHVDSDILRRCQGLRMLSKDLQIQTKKNTREPFYVWGAACWQD